MRRFAATAPGRLIAIRLGYLLLTAFTVLWVPIAVRPHTAGTPYGPHGQLIFRTFDRWDGRWFVRIAEHGYATRQTAAFLPVYPLLVRALAWIVRSHLVAGVLISLAAAGASALLLERIARRHLAEDSARTTVLLLALYPAAFVFTAAYSDSLFLLFVLLAVDAAERGRAVVAWLAAALAVDTRLLGLALIPTLVLLLWPEQRRPLAFARRLGPLLLVPLAIGLWMLYLHVHYGDALASAHAEHRYWHRYPLSPRWIWHEIRNFEVAVVTLVRHVPALAPGGHYPTYVQGAARDLYDFAFLAFGVLLSWVAWKRLGPALGLYSWLTLAIVVLAPTDWEPLISVGRFLLADFPIFLALASLLETRPRAREAVLVAFAAIGAILAIAFAHGVLVV